jgi:GMP synthase (glutamine-hydrolysing)
MPRALLVSLRDPSDPMALQERACFADRSALAESEVDIHPMVSGMPDVPGLKKYDAIFFGGSGAYSVLDDVPWIKQGIELCLRVADLQVPAWASCFGFQGLALALGSDVIRDASRTELGATPLELTDAGVADPLFGLLPRKFVGQEGHHDHVMSVPKGVTLLATGDISRNQGFRVDGSPFWASQFHPELTALTTTARFKYYMAHYADDPEQAARTLRHLETGQDSPECGKLLVRLVRHEF